MLCNRWFSGHGGLVCTDEDKQPLDLDLDPTLHSRMLVCERKDEGGGNGHPPSQQIGGQIYMYVCMCWMLVLHVTKQHSQYM